MWGILTNIVVSATISIVGAWGVYHYAPLSFLEGNQPTKFGSTITTIAGSDTLSGSRTTINTNFANLNADKIEATQTTLNSLTSATSLATLSALSSIGTITTGIWHGTAIGAQWGGTGSTTLSSNQVLLGNGTGNIGVVSAYGTSGQSLVSNGTGAAPTWQSVSFDQTANYNNTGVWGFSNTLNVTGNTLLKNLTASSTIQINNGGAGVSYVFPTSQGTASTTLMNDGSGNLSWRSPGSLFYATSTFGNLVKNTTAEFSLFSTTSVAANVLGTNNALHIRIPYLNYSHVLGHVLTIRLYYGTTVECTVQWSLTNDTYTNKSIEIDGYIYEAGSTAAQNCTLKVTAYVNSQSAIGSSITAGGYTFLNSGNGVESDTSAKNVWISAQWDTANSGDSLQTPMGAFIEKMY